MLGTVTVVTIDATQSFTVTINVEMNTITFSNINSSSQVVGTFTNKTYLRYFLEFDGVGTVEFSDVTSFKKGEALGCPYELEGIFEENINGEEESTEVQFIVTKNVAEETESPTEAAEVTETTAATKATETTETTIVTTVTVPNKGKCYLRKVRVKVNATQTTEAAIEEEGEASEVVEEKA